MMKRLLAAAFSLALSSPALADSIDFPNAECQAAPNSTACTNTMNVQVNPLPSGGGTNALATYVRQDGGSWVYVTCHGRDPVNSYTYPISLNWIFRDHLNEFRHKPQADCTPGIPFLTAIKKAVGFDPTNAFLAPPIQENGQWQEYAYVYRQAPGGPQEWLYFYDYLQCGGGKCADHTVKMPGWTQDINQSQPYRRRNAETLAAIGFNGNAAGPGAVNDFSIYAIDQSNQVLRNTLSYYWSAAYDKGNDAWLWGSGFQTQPPTLPVVTVKFPITADNHGQAVLTLIKNEAINSLHGRNYGVRELRGDIGICGTPGFPSVCQAP